MELTLCNKGLKGSIPRHHFDSKDEASDFIFDWLNEKDLDLSVFVCFANWRNLPIEKVRDEQNSILVSHLWDDISTMVDSYIDTTNFDKIDFSIFEFDSYKEAFNYCIDLRESF